MKLNKCMQNGFVIQAKALTPKDTSFTKYDDLRASGGVNLCGAHLHHVEKDFLPQAVLAFEELVLRVGAGDVSAD